VDGIDEPKGIVYLDIPRKCDEEDDVAEAMQLALGWSPDKVIDSDKRNYSSSLLVKIT
jgi:hypothetical protein